MIRHEKAVLTTTAKCLTTTVQDVEAGGYGQVTRRLVVTNEAMTNSVYLGGPEVSKTDYGYRLRAGASITLELTRWDNLFAVGDSGGEVLRLMHMGV